MLLVAPDVPVNFLNVAGAHLVKAITGQDPISEEHKNSNYTPPSRPIEGLPLVTTNTRLKLRLESDSGAWRRRLVLIPFEGESVPEHLRITDLDKELLDQEGPGILNWALAGLHAFREDNYLLRMTGRQEAIRDALLQESESHVSFVRECLVADRSGTVTSEAAYRSYLRFCQSREWPPMSVKVFGERVKEVIVSEFGVTQSHDLSRLGGRARGWRGISLTAGAERLEGPFDDGFTSVEKSGKG
jgi:phage/plasmid-associated DNA primase